MLFARRNVFKKGRRTNHVGMFDTSLQKQIQSIIAASGNGGSSSGIDDVLAVGQSFTDDRTIDCDGNTLVISGMDEFGIISPLGSGWTINGGADYDVNMVTTNVASELNLLGAGIIQIYSDVGTLIRGSNSATPPTIQLSLSNDSISIFTNNNSGEIDITAGGTSGLIDMNAQRIDMDTSSGDITLTTNTSGDIVLIAAGNINVTLPTYADDTAAGAGGLTTGDLYVETTSGNRYVASKS